MLKMILALTFPFYFIQGQTVLNMPDMNGPYNSEVISFLNYSDSIVFMTKKELGFLKSTDFGNSWNKIETGLQNSQLGYLVKHNNGDLFATVSSGGILRSTNAGESWLLTPSTQIGRARCLFSRSDGVLFAGGETQNLYRSSNLGETWTPISSLTIDALTATSSGTILMVSNSILYRSTTNGTSWSNIRNVSSTFHSLYTSSNNFIFYAGDRLLLRSTDDGITWSNINTNYYFRSVVAASDGVLFAGVGGSSGSVMKSFNYGSGSNLFWYGPSNINVHRQQIVNDEYLMIGAADGVYKNDFRLTNQFELAIKHPDVTDISIRPQLVYAVVDSIGYFRYYNNSWLQLFTTFQYTKNISSVFLGSKYLLGTKQHGLWISSNSGVTWNQLNIFHEINAQIISIKSVDISLIFCASKNDGIYISTNSGNNWSTSNIGLPEAYSVEDFDITSDGNCFAALKNYGIYFSSNKGLTWESRSFGFPLTAKTVSLSILEDYVLAATESNGVYITADQGQNWSKLFSGLPDTIINPVVRYHSSGKAFIAAGNSIYRSLDKGFNWTLEYTVPQRLKIISLAIDPNSVLYAGCNNGMVYRIIDIVIPVELISFAASIIGTEVRLTWSTASELNNYGFEIERSNDQAGLLDGESGWRTIGFKEGKGTTTAQQNYTFTDDLFGVNSHKLYYRLKQIDYDGRFEYSNVLEVEVTPLTFALHQNYPNPFNPVTKISWQSPVSSHQTLKVYDVLGREVATLIDEYKEAGYHEVEFDASSGIRDLPAGRQGQASGIYFYQLNAGSFIETKKMILIK